MVDPMYSQAISDVSPNGYRIVILFPKEGTFCKNLTSCVKRAKNNCEAEIAKNEQKATANLLYPGFKV